MTMHADQLMGAPVTDSDGMAIGTVEQVFRDDFDGTPSWARIRSARGLHFVPLAGSSMTSTGGLSVPFDSQKITTEPDIDVDQHMSVDQEEQLRSYFGLVPAQPTSPGLREAETRRTRTQPQSQGEPSPGEPARQPAEQAGRTGQEWLTRSEERFAVHRETRETGRVRLHKYVDTEPVEQTVRVFHEEYEIERIPISGEEQIGDGTGEREQEVILHEAQAIITKETVPVERIRLSVRKVEQDRTVTGELRKERIEIDAGTEPYSSA